MRLGFRLPTAGTLPTTLGVGAMARAAEAAGAESLWVGDHIVWVADYASPYPYSPDGKPPKLLPQTPFYEALTAMTWVAANTERARVGAAVLVLPQRDPVLLAKTAATLDALSGGRCVLGVGAGWLREELEALGWDWRTRGRRMEEAIAVMRACWTGAPAAFEGRFFSLPEGVMCFPTPVAGAVPVLVGGMTDAAIDRAARVGDGWFALANLAHYDASVLAERMARACAAERPDGLGPLAKVIRVVGEVDGGDRPLEQLRELAALGFEEAIVEVAWPDLASAAASIERVRAAIDVETNQSVR
jgi:probable F420-dependent oxidoreductase